MFILRKLDCNKFVPNTPIGEGMITKTQEGVWENWNCKCSWKNSRSLLWPLHWRIDLWLQLIILDRHWCAISVKPICLITLNSSSLRFCVRLCAFLLFLLVIFHILLVIFYILFFWGVGHHVGDQVVHKSCCLSYG